MGLEYGDVIYFNIILESRYARYGQYAAARWDAVLATRGGRLLIVIQPPARHW